MRDYKNEFDKRVAFIQSVLSESGAEGIVYGNSGGKDSALVGILCKAACQDTVGIILPCTSEEIMMRIPLMRKKLPQCIILKPVPLI